MSISYIEDNQLDLPDLRSRKRRSRQNPQPQAEHPGLSVLHLFIDRMRRQNEAQAETMRMVLAAQSKASRKLVDDIVLSLRQQSRRPAQQQAEAQPTLSDREPLSAYLQRWSLKSKPLSRTRRRAAAAATATRSKRRRR